MRACERADRHSAAYRACLGYSLAYVIRSAFVIVVHMRSDAKRFATQEPTMTFFHIYLSHGTVSQQTACHTVTPTKVASPL